MEERDYRNYLDLYQEMIKLLPPPDLMIYLRKSLPRLVSQIKQRGRDYEQNIPEDYLTCLNKYYEEWIGAYNTGKLLIIDSDELDFVSHPEHFDHIAEKILDKLDQRDLFLPLAASPKAVSR
jgi:deoxyadenosine/deoxycytidine kinase